MVAILIISAKLATLGYFKIKVFWNKDYDAIVSLSLAVWSKFGNSSISMEEVITTSNL